MRAMLAVLSLMLIDLYGGSGLADEHCHPKIDPQVPQYVIGYGSLMENASKARTAPDTGACADRARVSVRPISACR